MTVRAPSKGWHRRFKVGPLILAGGAAVLLGVLAEVLGYLLTMYDKRERITVEVEGILRRRFGDKVFTHPIRQNTKQKAAPSHKKTIFEFEPEGGKGRQDYEWLTDEVEQRLAGNWATQVVAPA